MAPDGIGQRFQQGGALADPIGQGGAVDIQPLTVEDLGRVANVVEIAEQRAPGM